MNGLHLSSLRRRLEKGKVPTVQTLAADLPTRRGIMAAYLQNRSDPERAVHFVIHTTVMAFVSAGGICLSRRHRAITVEIQGLMFCYRNSYFLLGLKKSKKNQNKKPTTVDEIICEH